MTGRLWFMVACGVVIVLIGGGLRQIFGVFQVEVTQELDIGFGPFGLVIGIQALILGITQPASGLLADKFGSVRVIIAGALIYALGLWWAGQSTTAWELAVSLGLIVGIGLTGPTQVLVLGAVGKVIPDNRRSFIFGTIIASTSLGGALLIPVVFQVIQSFDWRTAFSVAALVIVVLPLVALGLYNKGPAADGGPRQSIRDAMTEARSHSGFILLTLGFFVCGFHVSFIGTHLPAFLTDSGLSPEFSAGALSIVLFCNVIGALLFGTLGDRFSKKNLLTLLYAARAALMITILMVPISETTTIIFCVAMGILMAFDRTADQLSRRSDLRDAIFLDAFRDCFYEPPDWRISRRMACRLYLRHNRIVRPDVDCGSGPWRRLRAASLADPGTTAGAPFGSRKLGQLPHNPLRLTS